MLPRLLCDRLCSLNPDEDRLTYSVIWTMDEKDENRCIFSFVILFIKSNRQNNISHSSCMLIFDKTHGHIRVFCKQL